MLSSHHGLLLLLLSPATSGFLAGLRGTGFCVRVWPILSDPHCGSHGQAVASWLLWTIPHRHFLFLWTMLAFLLLVLPTIPRVCTLVKAHMCTRITHKHPYIYPCFFEKSPVLRKLKLNPNNQNQNLLYYPKGKCLWLQTAENTTTKNYSTGWPRLPHIIFSVW